MNERIYDAVEALPRNNVSGSSENSTLRFVYCRASGGRSSSERVTKNNVNIAFIVSVKDAQAYNNTTRFLFDLNYEKKRSVRSPNIREAHE